ncbi:MAG: oxidoreductase [Rhodospirillaceae bacterium]|nr:oxidoreductase [Rhodospirillaceae bacterium]|tara:strand:+ start:680 stop:1735 length:1056 start_codon:yes stop_codon:yes gene_type:complete
MTYNFGIIGLGMIARFHAQAINATEGLQLSAVFSRSKNKAEEFCAEFGGEPYTNFSKFLAHQNLQAVSICTPSGAHLEPCLASAKAGKHIVCEKPLEISPERIDKIIRACEVSGVMLSGIFPRRFNGSTQELKKAIIQGRFGTITMADSYIKWWRDQKYYDSADWRGTWELDGGGALMNQSIHTIDLLLHLMGPVKTVRAKTRLLAHSKIEVEDTAVAILEFETGALGVIQGSTGSWSQNGHPAEIHITGSHGSVFMADDRFRVWEFKDETSADNMIRKIYSIKTDGIGAGAADPLAIDFRWHARNYGDILQALKEGRSPSISGWEARRSVALICAIYESALLGGKKVEVV